MRKHNRRSFLKGALGATAASALSAPLADAAGTIVGSNERFRMAIAGLKGRGGAHIGGFAGISNLEIAYLVDPDENQVNRRIKEVNGRVKGRYKPEGIADIRDALEDKTVDAISVATPNHWHSLMTIWAAQAKKHCYVEKPASHDVYEGRVAMEAWKKYGVVIQHGTQRRSDARYAGVHEAIKAGKWGKLKIAYGYCCKPRGGIGFKKPSDPPSNLDWDLWQGPAKVGEYHGNYVHYNWHWFWNTGNGDLNNQGTHQLDVARWALDDDQTHPIRVIGLGGRFQWNDQGETPNTMFAAAEYPNGQWVFFNVRNVNYKGYQHQVLNEYYFEDGGRLVQDGHVYIPPGKTKGERIKVKPGKVTPGGNWKSFITACREGDPMLVNGNMAEAHYGCVLGHLMNNSYRLGKEVPFNAKAGKFGDNKDAYEHFMKLHSIMKDGVGVPEDKAKYTVGPWLKFDPKTERHIGDHAEAANKLLRDPNRKGFEIPDVSVV